MLMLTVEAIVATFAYISSHPHIFTFCSLQGPQYPREALHFFAYIPGDIWTIQHLTVTLTFKDHWPHHLHDLT